MQAKAVKAGCLQRANRGIQWDNYRPKARDLDAIRLAMKTPAFESSALVSSKLTRRTFLRGATLGLASVTFAHAIPETQRFVQTVLGPIESSKLGFTLPHEHVMCDFVGAEQTSRSRWEVDAVAKRMRPILSQLKERGVTGFIDCTPAYIGRDPRVLKRLAQETGLHIVTNTGYYGGADDKFVPKHAYAATEDQLADLWLGEWKHGIEDTGVKPGFIKIGVDEIKGGSAALSSIDEKLVRVSARVSKQTGLAVTCHTGGGQAGLTATKVFINEKADPARFIVAHSDSHGLATNRMVAELGAWVSFDAIGRQTLEYSLGLVHAMAGKYAGRVLLSQDSGWYWVGQKSGGEIRDFNYISDILLPALRTDNHGEAIIRQLTVGNPDHVFAVKVGHTSQLAPM
jgi:predicted metal-dependent phosphotriesterase family hydrolase